MAIFNSYVKLPEGIRIQKLGILMKTSNVFFVQRDDLNRVLNTALP